MVNFWATVKGNTFHGKLLWLLFGQLLEEIGLLFNIASSYYAPDLNNGITPPHRAALRVVGPILQNTFFDISVNCRKRRNSSAPMDHRVFDFHQMAVHKRTTILAHCNSKQNTWLCSKQSSLFSFYALPSGGKSKDVVVHFNGLTLPF